VTTAFASKMSAPPTSQQPVSYAPSVVKHHPKEISPKKNLKEKTEGVDINNEGCVMFFCFFCILWLAVKKKSRRKI
jgi:hypothetical protein